MAGRRPASSGGVPGGPGDRPDPRPSGQELAERYGRTIYTTAYRLTGDPHDAADLTQEVFLRVLRTLDRYEPGSFEGWLYRVTKNLFLDGVRRRQRLRTDELPEGDWQQPASTDDGPADIVERRHLEERLESALATLSPERRLAIVLCDVQGLSYEEIATATGWPIGTVRSRIHRARAQLRDWLLAHDTGPSRRGAPG